MEVIISLPDEVKARLDGFELIIDGPKGTVSKVLKSPLVSVSVKDVGIVISSPRDNRRGKRVVNSFRAHVRNLIQGVIDGFEAQLRICYAHFPISVKVEGDDFIINNFGGEKVPRHARIMPDVSVKVDGSDVVCSGLNKELVGQTAANIELATRIKNRDSRVFQDGIWIVKKPGKEGL